MSALIWLVKVMVVLAFVGTIHEAGWGDARFGLILLGIAVVWLGIIVIALVDDPERRNE